MSRKIIVIGAGAGGLTCATKLAQKLTDDKVTLIDLHPYLVGGLAQAWTRLRKIADDRKIKATFELTHAITGMQPGAHFHQMYSDLGVDWSNVGHFSVAPYFVRMITADGKTLETPNEIQRTLEHLLQEYPEKREGITKLFNLWKKMEQERYPSDDLIKWEESMKKKIKKLPGFLQFPATGLTFLRTRPRFVWYHRHNYQQLLDQFLKGEDEKTKELKALLSSDYGYIGIKPEHSSALYHTCMKLAYWMQGGPQAPAENSFQALHEEVARVFQEKHQGELRLNTKMVDYVIENGKITGVKVVSKGKKEILPADVVIGAGDFKRMVEPLGNYLPEKYRRKIEETEMSLSFAGTHFITDLPLHEMHDKLNAAAIVLAPSIDSIRLEHENNFPEQYMLYCNVPTVLRPEAKLITDATGNPVRDLHIVDVVMRSPAYEKCKGLKETNPAAYKKNKENMIHNHARIISELLIPDFQNNILYCEAYTAATVERFADTTNGAVLSMNGTVNQFLNRFGPETPFPNLFLGGSVIQSAGVNGAADGGIIAADAVLEYLKRK